MDELFVDACCILNILATGRARELVAELGFRTCFVADAVVDETLYLEDRAIDFEELAAVGLTVTTALTQEEKQLYVELSAALDDGEAMTCALAVCRAGLVATDDRKAIRVLSQLAPDVPTLTTPGLMKRWSEEGGIEPEILGELLNRIQTIANFVPGRL